MTNNETYLTLLLNYIESGLYHRIRTRLNMKNDIRFKNIPDGIIQRENSLRNKVNSVFNDTNKSVDVIYNCNLSSNLAILTACETGKPSYKSGQGMISLAHAFNYAGSESILTSLWKIDEKSSAQIVGYFYDNLKNGMLKDEALRNAKLTYLSTAQGRTLEPNYWAGLVLMGDTSSLELASPVSTMTWFISAIVGIIGLIFSYRLYKAKGL